MAIYISYSFYLLNRLILSGIDVTVCHTSWKITQFDWKILNFNLNMYLFTRGNPYRAVLLFQMILKEDFECRKNVCSDRVHIKVEIYYTENGWFSYKCMRPTSLLSLFNDYMRRVVNRDILTFIFNKNMWLDAYKQTFFYPKGLENWFITGLCKAGIHNRFSYHHTSNWSFNQISNHCITKDCQMSPVRCDVPVQCWQIVVSQPKPFSGVNRSVQASPRAIVSRHS